MEKLLIYTALFGDIDKELKEPLVSLPNCDLVCYTNKKNLKSNNWKIEIANHYYLGVGTTDRLKARLVKTFFPHLFFNNYKIYLWIDSSGLIKKDPYPLIEEYMENADILAFKHPDRNCIEKEAVAAIRCRGTNKEEALMQVAKYRAKGFTSAIQKTITTTGFLFRHNNKKIEKFNMDWHEEILGCTYRDQLSIDYCAWKNDIKINYLPGSFRNNDWVKFYPHKVIRHENNNNDRR